MRKGNPLALSAAPLEAPLPGGLPPGTEPRALGKERDVGRGEGGKEGKHGKPGKLGGRPFEMTSPAAGSQFARHRPLHAAKGREAEMAKEMSPIKESTIKALDRLLNDTLFKFPASDMLGPLVLAH